MKRLSIFVPLFLCVSITSIAQTLVRGVVVDSVNVGAPFATIVITDSSLNTLENATTDSLGFFEINLPAKVDDKILYVSCVGYKTLQIKSPTSAQVGRIVMQRLAFDIEAVSVVANRPKLVRQSGTLAVVGVHSLPMAQGKSTFDFLKYTPLVSTNSEGEVSILGRGKAIVYVDGRVSGIDLSSLPAENIERIEIITNPGSKYPASCRGGIVNVVMRRPPDDGTMLNLSVGDRQNRCNSPNASAFVSFKHGKNVITTGASASSSGFVMDENSRYNYLSSNLSTVSNYSLDSRSSYANAYFNYDYLLSGSHTLGFRLQGGMSDADKTQTTEGIYGTIGAQQPDSTDLTTSELSLPTANYSLRGNLNYRWSIDEWQKFAIDFDYVDARSDYKTQYKYAKNGMLTPADDFVVRPKSTTSSFAAKATYKNELDIDVALDMGLIATSSSVHDDYFYGLRSADGFVSNPLRSNVFNFDELTSAAYVSALWDGSDVLEATLGLRAEYYSYNGEQRTTNEAVSDEKFGLFPSLSLYFMPNDDHEILLEFSRGIFRPSYAMLNLFKSYYSQVLYYENNPNLKSSIDYDFELGYTLMNNYMLFVYYTFSTDSWAEFRLPAGDGITKIMNVNYSKDHDLEFVLSLNQKMFRGYFDLIVEPTLAYSKSEGDVEGISVNYDDISYSFMVRTFVALNKEKDFNLLARYQYKSESTMAAYVLGSYSGVDVSISKTFGNRGTLSLGISDIAYRPQKMHKTFSTYSYSTTRDMSMRTVWLSYSMKFGNTKVKSASTRYNQDLENRLAE